VEVPLNRGKLGQPAGLHVAEALRDHVDDLVLVGQQVRRRVVLADALRQALERGQVLRVWSGDEAGGRGRGVFDERRPHQQQARSTLNTRNPSQNTPPVTTDHSTAHRPITPSTPTLSARLTFIVVPSFLRPSSFALNAAGRLAAPARSRRRKGSGCWFLCYLGNCVAGVACVI
jgi:hypothetical protein